METNRFSDFLTEKPRGFLIVGLGASAGGIEALKAFFEHVPEDSHMAYVVILHLSPDHDSQLAQVLQAVTALPVTQVREKVEIEPDHIYVVPPNQHLIMEEDYIVPSINVYTEERRAPVDIFFRTLADSHGPRAVSVILSGTGANGSMGLKRVKERGGAAYVQNPREAEFNEMPRSAIATELIDQVLPVREIPGHLVAYRNSLVTVEIAVEEVPPPEPEQLALRGILTQLRLRTGHDFSNYKRPTLRRRVERRINVRGLPDLPSYAAFLQQNTEESQALLKDLLISVTNFFRDKKPFAALEGDVLPALFQNKKSGDEVRIWVAGCATGEEAYSLAMLVAERTIGVLDAPKVQIFATDLDEAAIAAAREGLYTLNDAADVSAERLQRFFKKEGDHYRVTSEIREMILFANHNFLKDPPFSRLDLVSCRNVLIYLNATAQERVMETFHFALKPGGYLFLGSAESVDGASDLYATVSRDHRIYQARQATLRHYPVPESVPHLLPKPPPAVKPSEAETRPPNRLSFGELHQKLLEQYAPPSLVVNEEYDIVHMSEKVGSFLEFSGGEPTKNLLKLVKPQLRLELRSALYQALQGQTAIEARNVGWTQNGQTQSLTIHVKPVTRPGDPAKGFLLVLFEPREPEQNQQKVVLASDEPIARHLEEELTQVKAQLRLSHEQHEYQAEELKASNEELQAMNEELRSAAEELETSKEELQSINEELRTVNQELKVKIEEISIASNNLQNLINSADVATIFLDRAFCTRLYTPAARHIFNLIPSDYGRPISDITHRLENGNLLPDAQTVLEKLTIIEREVTTTDGRAFMMRMLPYRTSEDRINGVVITFFDITLRKQAEKALLQSQQRLQLLIESAKDYAILSFNTQRQVVSWSSGAQMMFGYREADIVGKSGDIIFIPEDRDQGVPEWEAKTAAKEGRAENERWHLRQDGSRFWGSGSTRPLRDEEGNIIGFVKIMRDLTVARRLEEAKFFLAAIIETSNDSVITIDFQRNITSWNKAAQHLYGYTAQEAIGKNLTMLTLPEDFSKVLSNVDAIVHSREVAVFDTVRHTKEGQPVHLEIVMSPVLNTLGEVIGISTIARDVSERKRREANLAFLAKINLDLAPLLTVPDVLEPLGQQLATYLQLSGCQFSMVDEAGDRVEVIYQYPGDETIPSSMGVHRLSDTFTEEGRRHLGAGKLALISPAAEGALVKTPRHLLKQLGFGSRVDVPHLEGERWQFLLTVGRAEVGEWRNDELELLQELAAKIYIRLERARAEEALRQSEEKYRTLFDSIDEGFNIVEVLFDESGKAVDYIFLEINRAHERMSGLPSDLAGKRISQVVPGLDEKVLVEVGKVALTGEPLRYELYVSALDKWYEVYTSRVGGNSSRKVANVFNDITERKTREQQQAFLLGFSDTLRAEPGVDAVANRALQLLCEHLRLDRCYVGVYQLAHDRGEFPYQVGNDRVLPMPDSVRLSDFPDALQVAFHRTLVIEDVAKAEGLTESDRKNLGALGLCALVAASLRTGEANPVWSIVAVSARPRHWALSEIKLIEEVTERTWAAIERVKAEEALRKSEEQFRRAIQEAPIPVIMHAEDGEVLQISRTWTELTGYSPQEVLTFEGWLMEAYGEGANDVRRHMQALFEGRGRTLNIDFPVRTRQGGLRHWSFSASSPGTLSDGRRFIVGMAVDITERKQAQEQLQAFNQRLERQVHERTKALKESRDLLQSVFDTTLFSLLVLNARRDESGAIVDFGIRMVNRQLETLTGRTDLVGNLLGELYPGIRERGLLALMLQVMETGEPAQAEYYYGHEGFDAWFTSTFVKMDDGLLVTNLDITARKEAELENEKHLQILKQAEAVAPMGSWAYDVASGQFTWSDGMYRLFDLPIGSPVGPSIYLDYVIEEDRPVAEKIVRHLQESQQPLEETFRIAVDGKQLTLKIKAILMPGEQGRPLKVLGVDLDISELKRLEGENLHMRLQQQQALLNAILDAQEEERRRISESLHNGVGQLLYATKLNLTGVNLEALPHRKTEVEASLQKTYDLLTEAIVETRRVSHELVPVLLKDFGLQKAIEEFCSRFARTGIQIDCHCFPERLPVPLETAIYRMGQELVNNIIKHSGASRARLEISKDRDFVYLEAQDNGKGMDGDEQRGQKPGKGIGMSTIQDRVELLGGRLEIDSTPGKGTLITISLPLKKGT